MERILIVSHTDLDGYASGWLNYMRVAHPYIVNKNVTHHSLNIDYDEVDMVLDPEYLTETYGLGVMVYITDLNLTLSQAERLDKALKEGKLGGLELLDHHATGKEAAEAFPWYILDTSRSATSMVWERLKYKMGRDVAPFYESLVSAVNAADTYKEGEPLFRYGRAMSSHIYKMAEGLDRNQAREPIHNYFKSLIGLNFKRFVEDEDKNLYKSELEAIGELANGLLYWEAAVEVAAQTTPFETYTSNGVTYAIIDTETSVSISDLGNRLLKLNSNLDFLGFILSKGENKILSLRSIIVDGQLRYNVGELAKKYGGGGHPAAAGCTITPEMNLTRLV